MGLSSGQASTFTYATNAENFTTGVSQSSDAAVPYPPGTLTQTAGYNSLNQLTNLSGQVLTWDANGNLLSDGARTYAWDAENRLVAIGYPGQPGKATTFAYDGLGRRVQTTSTPAGGGAAMTTGYVWCGGRICQARGAGGAVTRGYYAEGEFIPGSPAQSLYYAPDQLGSVRRAFSAAAAPTYDYDPYGRPLQVTAPVTDFNYAGTIYNADSGLYLAGARAYDPVAGRWLSRDPAGEGADGAGNLYAYVGGNPISLTDPAGLGPGRNGGIPPLLLRVLATVAEGGGPENPVSDGFAVALIIEAPPPLPTRAPERAAWSASRRWPMAARGRGLAVM